MRKSSLIPLPSACGFWKAHCRESLHGGKRTALSVPRQPPIPLGGGQTEKEQQCHLAGWLPYSIHQELNSRIRNLITIYLMRDYFEKAPVESSLLLFFGTDKLSSHYGVSTASKPRCGLTIRRCCMITVENRRWYDILGALLRAAEAWVKIDYRERPHESLGYRSPHQFAEVNQLQTLPYLAMF